MRFAIKVISFLIIGCVNGYQQTNLTQPNNKDNGGN
jgi:hypothetical protein